MLQMVRGTCLSGEREGRNSVSLEILYSCTAAIWTGQLDDTQGQACWT
jgi:hypothetical protein